jgi:hypothetical protein
MGEKADAFDDGDDLAAEIEQLAELVGDVETAHEQASDLASTVPELKNTIEDAGE